MNCPICGSTATRVNTNYWCPYDKIYLGQTLAFSAPVGSVPTLPQYQEIIKKPAAWVKFFDKFTWVVMGVLYIIVIAFVAWAFLFGGFGDTSSIFSYKYSVAIFS